MVKPFLTIVGILMSASLVLAQTDTARDSIAIEIDTSVIADSAPVVIDSTEVPLAANIDDSIRIVFPNIDPDTLSAAQRLLAEHETRLNLRFEAQRALEIPDDFSFFDSLVTYFMVPEWNRREDIDRSFYRDAGDYFKSDPSFFILEPQVTPMRKTVQPYALAGHRLGLIVGGRPLRPLEHMLEPDGLVDMNDVPTALDHTVAILPGPVGQLFGGDHAVATLLTLPEAPNGNRPESSFLVDKGTFAYSFARGRFSRKLSTGREIDVSLEYRNADGLLHGRADDAYNYTGDILFPMGPLRAVRVSGRLYDRRGPYPVRPDPPSNSHTAGGVAERGRFDRQAEISYLIHSDNHISKTEVGYTHTRQASHWSTLYLANLNLTGHGLSFSHEKMWGNFATTVSIKGDYSEFDSWHEQHDRISGVAELRMARLTQPVGLAIGLSQTYVEGFKFLPAATAILNRGTDKSLVVLSGGYSERAPSFLELYLPNNSADIYRHGARDYADGGNRDLASEKQLIGSLEYTLGRQEKSLGLSVVGGQIWDGIDWQPSVDSAGTEFRPTNGDITFANLTGSARLELSDLLRFKAGGSYHHLEYDNFTSRAYTPEYQAFSGMELHLYWKPKLIDFWIYGEAVYVGPYHGLELNGLGEKVIMNMKLSFKMGKFRFHWISQNTTSVVHSQREYWQNPGLFTSYGFTWDFTD